MVVMMVMMVVVDPVVMMVVMVPVAMMVVMVPPAIVVVVVMMADADVDLRDLDILPGLLLRLAHHGRVGGPQHRYGIRNRVEQLGVGPGGWQRVRRRRGLRGTVE